MGRGVVDASASANYLIGPETRDIAPQYGRLPRAVRQHQTVDLALR